MLAANVKTFPVDADIVAEFADPARLPGRFISVAPRRDKWHSNIEWISPDDEEGFGVFESAFQRLGIPEQAAPYLDLDRDVRLYFGFLVVRSRCTEAYFHHDWRGLNNEAFTFMAPATANAAGFGLLYKKLTGETAEYEYRPGEGIMFGDNFEQSRSSCSASSSAATRWSTGQTSMTGSGSRLLCCGNLTLVRSDWPRGLTHSRLN